MTGNLKNFPSYDTEDLWRKDRDHFIHPWTDFSSFKEEGSLVIAESEGCYVFDSDGNKLSGRNRRSMVCQYRLRQRRNGAGHRRPGPADDVITRPSAISPPRRRRSLPRSSPS